MGLLFIIAIMGIGLAVTGQVWDTAQRRAKEEELLYVGDQFRRAIAQYAVAGSGYPHALEDLLKDPRFPGVRRHLRTIYPDPITGRADWGLVKGPGDVILGVRSLSDDEPIKKDGFRPVDQAFEGKMKYSEWVFAPRLAGAASLLPQSGADPSTMAQPQPATNAPRSIANKPAAIR